VAAGEREGDVSYTEMFAARESGDMERVTEFQNAWLGAMMVWQEFGKRYCGFGEDVVLLCDKAKMRQVWGLYTDREKVPEEDRVTLGTTFDNALVPGHALVYVSECMEKTAEWLPSHSHIGEQAKFLRELARDPAIRAVGWNQTSVCADPWSMPPDGDDEYAEERPYNIDRDTGHWWMFEPAEPVLTPAS
jgi:hypothetical protein